MTYHSILFPNARQEEAASAAQEPVAYRDLHLDQVVRALTFGRGQYHLEPFFHAPLRDVEAVLHRQDVMRDFEAPAVLDAVESFARGMNGMREILQRVDQLHNPLQKRIWRLAAIDRYVSVTRTLASDMARLPLASSGMQKFREDLDRYIASTSFGDLATGVGSLTAELDRVHYCVHINGSRVTVRRCEGEADYSSAVLDTFAKFQAGAAKDYRVTFPRPLELDGVETQVLERVSWLYPETFTALEEFTEAHRAFVEPIIERFDREAQFYMAFLDVIRPMRAAGLPFCYPALGPNATDVRIDAGFDLSLAAVLQHDQQPVVTNDVSLHAPERIIVITGPNQGGKTTFARMIGQAHALAGLGLLVPGTQAKLFLPDQIFTHFEREESLATLRSKLEDELVRIHDILESATDMSLLIMNESFSSTTAQDALLLGKAVLERVLELGMTCVYVTFLDELAALGPVTVSMMSMVDPDDPATRTYKVVRAPANGLAYAGAIAAKYGLGYETLRKRIAQ